MNTFKIALSAFAVLAPLAIVGCGGGNGSPSPKVDVPVTNDPNIAAANFLGLRTDGLSLATFRGNLPSAATTRNVTGLPLGVRLRGIDARVAPALTGSNGVAAIYALGSNNQLYTLDLTGNGAVANAVGGPVVFDGFTLGDGAYGFDVNPAADRLRVVSGTQNARINPNTGAAVDGDAVAAGVNPDGTLAYDAGDANNNRTPNITAAGYTNNDADTATGTVNYGIDTNLNVLVTQGRPASGTVAAVSPNTGTLFTVGSLGADLPTDAGLEVFGTGNTAVATGGRTFYAVDLTSGALTNIGTIGGGADITDITVAIP